MTEVKELKKKYYYKRSKRLIIGFWFIMSTASNLDNLDQLERTPSLHPFLLTCQTHLSFPVSPQGFPSTGSGSGNLQPPCSISSCFPGSFSGLNRSSHSLHVLFCWCQLLNRWIWRFSWRFGWWHPCETLLLWIASGCSSWHPVRKLLRLVWIFQRSSFRTEESGFQRVVIPLV